MAETSQWLTDGTFYNDEYVLDHTSVPQNPQVIPEIIGWSGPGRSGTTALLLLMASQKVVDAAHFQPQKTLIRKGEPDFVIDGSADLICTKEVFGFLHPEENYDPVGHLLKAGVPAEKISWITVLRNPAKAYASWKHYAPATTPRIYAAAQEHALDLYEQYKGTIRSTPFAYDLLGGSMGAEPVLEAVLSGTPLGNASLNTTFDPDAIRETMVWGQAADPAYYERLIAGTIRRGEFSYSDAYKPLPPEETASLGSLCMDRYMSFYDHSREALGI
jgi:hypothetical protein